MIKKKYVYMLIAVFLLGISVMAAGCGGNDKTETTEEALTTEKAAVAEESGTTEVAEKTEETTTTEVAEKTEETTTTEVAEMTEKAASTEETAKQENKTMIYVALGDSLSYGFGLGDRENDSFPSVVEKKLKNSGIECKNYNYGVNGLESQGLLDMIRKGETGMLMYADVITIDIGANDIFHSMDRFLYSTFLGTDMTAEEYEAEYAEFEKSLKKDLENSKAIMEEIRKINDHAQVIWLTIYNPYKNVFMPLNIEGKDYSLSEFSGMQVKLLNENIRAVADEYGCDIADCYTAFEITPMNALNSNTEGNFDIHPTKDGYAIMAEVSYSAIKKED